MKLTPEQEQRMREMNEQIAAAYGISLEEARVILNRAVDEWERLGRPAQMKDEG